ncbi:MULTISPECIES: SLC13 family permease [unclassified Synechococcus]|uniref:SLC13 family permease n=1 Tax=unclassified Synechococcus TaxID=2626047 RepID=UPI0000699342|nr:MULTISPECIES: SLC13 family permease [unclassified Synechococcus]EAQ76325.1 putative sodium/sulfate transporter, DASS family protein [Synechococcus sp. WH 5701]WFN59009.1 SLC13 family permease [Synechococcus sp. CCFWC 502]
MDDLLQAALQPQALITLLVLALAIVLFISGWLAPELTGLLAASLLMATGVLKPAEAVEGFGSTALVTLMGLFALSAGLFRSGALDRLRALIGSNAVRSPKRMITLMVAVVGPVSGFIPNTPIVATLLPVIEGWCHRHRIAPSKVLLPLSFATVLGGTLTLLGSSVNLLASDVSKKLGYGEFDLFSFTGIGLGVWLVGGAMMVVLADRFLPNRGVDEDDLMGGMARSGYLTEVLIPRNSELLGRSLHDSRLQRRFDLDVLELHRASERFLPPLADMPLVEHDRLLLRCGREDLLRLQQERMVTLAPAKLEDGEIEAVDAASQRTVEVLLPAGSTLAGESLRDLRFRQRYNATVLALRRGNEVLRERLGRIVLRDGDVVLLQAPRDAIRGLQANNDLVVLEQLEKDLPTASRKGVAMVIALLAILLPTFKLLPLVASVLLGTVAMVASGCLRPGDLQRSIRLDVILLLGSLASFSVALEKTGLAEAIAKAMLLMVKGWPVFWALVMVFLFTTLLTEVMSNAATVALVIPIAAQLAQGLGQQPMGFIFTVLFGASQSFLSPVGYQTNLMVFGPGRYRFLDVARYGLPLTLTMTLLVPWLICRQFGI